MAEICLVLTGATIKENLDIVNRNLDLITMVELRTDLLEKDQLDLVSSFPGLVDLPVVLTCRNKKDGGNWNYSEKLRLEKLFQWLDGGFSFIDLEIDLEIPNSLVEKAGAECVKIIRSFHDFDSVPSDLYEKMVLAAESDLIIKAAVYPKSSEELFNLINVSLRLKNNKNINKYILLGMGDFGFPTRILAEKLGSYLTFCSDSLAESGAPGHCSASDLTEIYNFKSIGDETTVFSIIGNPLKQSKSPIIHNKGYKKLRLNSIYIPFVTDSLEWFMKIADLLYIRGSSVTVPYKSEIIPFIENIDKSVNEIGASNTIFRDEKNKWSATNTDAYGFIKPLLDFLKRKDLLGIKVALIGAGGAAKAALFALQEQGAEVTIFNRTIEKGRALADKTGCEIYPLEADSTDKLKEYSSIIVQTTNAGMYPLENINPVSFYQFSGNELLYDIIYKPEVTKFLQKGIDAGCKILGGYKMLEEQAYKQFKIYTGMEYPVE